MIDKMACCAAFHGHISEIPEISVDNFTNRHVKAYFLSHTHTDHTHGLYDREFVKTLETNDALIYMSEMSAAIIKYEIKCRLNGNLDSEKIIDRIRPLGIETTPIILSPDNHGSNETDFVVTLIMAGHSLGSVMFLFRTKTKTVLYTGDFRISTSDVSKFSQLHNKKAPIHIDTLYVDTTFMDMKYTTFPKRSDSVEAVLCEIRKWLEDDENNRVAVKTSAKFGYEFVFNEIFIKLGLKVYVEEHRWRELYSNIPHLVPGVTNEKSKIHLCWPKRLKNHKNCFTFETIDNLNFLYIHLSAMKWTNYQSEDSPIEKLSNNEIDVCFSTHCSRRELVYFVHYFDVKKVVGFPNEFDNNSPVKKFDDEFVFTPKKARVVDKKMDREVLRKIFDF